MESIILNALPSIRENISVQHSEAPQNHVIDETDSDEDDLHHNSNGEGFSFGISTVDRRHKIFDLTADEMFHHGRIIPLYSASNHSPLSMDDTDTDASPRPLDETFDATKTAPGSPKKSWSTGSIRTQPNTIRELLSGGRSYSDGKDKLGSIENGSSSVSSKKKNKKKKKEKGKGKTESKDVKKTEYTKNGEKGIIVKSKEKDVLMTRRSFLPYIRFFGSGPIHAFTKKFFV